MPSDPTAPLSLSSSSESVDFASKIIDEDHALVERLYKVSNSSPKLIRSTVYAAPADQSIQLRSWKMNEFKYYDIPSPFPTLARGLFTQEVKVGNEVKYRIVVRGYDKFFNIGEVPWNSWAALEQHTQPPYTLTLKSNGCIIFIAALTPTRLVVTSKHAVGAANEPQAHSRVGYKWLLKHLESVNKTEEDLAKFLWEKNWTAVAELCDDSFEEHVLPYGKEETGLHLHGLNECSKHFKTMLQDVVDAFAKEWGFIQTASVVLKTISEVKSFTDEIGRTGKWNGKALEGFVVRTHVSSQPPTKGDKPVSASPYEPGSSFFFKVKFDEPYMMYRDWREVTKTLLSKGLAKSNVPKNKLRRPETKAYVQWVINEANRDPMPFKDYTKGRGIIATRERFLEWLETAEGQDVLKGVKSIPAEAERSVPAGSKGDKTFGKTVIVPVAIPGVGKTSVAIALKHLFGFGHTQSDDIRAKKAAPVFVQNVVNSLKKYDVVIADKNNHLRQHRQQLRNATKNMIPPVRLMALNWAFDIPHSSLHRICSDRISVRGDNHQTLRADNNRSYEDVLWKFLKQAEELQEDEVDVCVEMDVEEDLESALKRAVDACVEVLGLPRPDGEKMGEALAAVRGYAPRTKKDSKEKAPAQPRYYALLPEFDFSSLLEEKMQGENVPVEARAFWIELVQNERIGDRVPHITIVHTKSLDGDNQKLWDDSRDLCLLTKRPTFTLKLGNIVWNDRVMAITVSDLSVSTHDDDDPNSEEYTKAVDFVSHLPDDVRNRLHITIGTRTKDIPPVEAKELVTLWKGGAKEGIGSFALGDVTVKGTLKGLMR